MRQIMAGLVLLAGCSGDDEELPSEKFEFQGAIHTVVVTGAAGPVSLTAASGPVTVEFRPREDGDNFQYEETAGRLLVGSVCKDGTLGCGTAIDVTLPAGTDFEVTTEIGPVSITGMEVSGLVETGAGPITGSRLGPMILETHSQTGAQSMQFLDVPTSVLMDGGSSGDLSLTLPGGDYQLSISAGGTTTTSGVQDGPSGPDVILNTGGNVTVNGV